MLGWEMSSIVMRKVKVAIVVLGLVFAISGSMSNTASAAWLVKGTVVSTGVAVVRTARVTQNAVFTFNNISITCTTGGGGMAGVIESPSMGSAASIVFGNCSVTSGNPPCTLEMPGEPGTIGTAPVLAEVTLEGVLAAKAVFKPRTKSAFATIKFAGATCSVSGVEAIGGAATVSMPTGQDSRTSQEVVINTPSGELKMGSNAVTLTGKVLLKLASGLPWDFM